MKICMAGALGRMGRRILEMAAAADDAEIGSAFDAPSNAGTVLTVGGECGKPRQVTVGGDAAEAIKNGGRVVEAQFRTSFVEHAYMEPESCVALPEPDGSVTVHGGMQHPFTTRRFVAAATGLPLSRARVIQTTLGGGFGGKDDTISIVCARAAILALRTKRPVKITYTR